MGLLVEGSQWWPKDGWSYSTKRKKLAFRGRDIMEIMEGVVIIGHSKVIGCDLKSKQLQ